MSRGADFSSRKTRGLFSRATRESNAYTDSLDFARSKAVKGMGVTQHPLCSDETSRRLGDVPTDEALILRLQESFARIELDGDDFSNRFYGRLFERHPSLRSMFPSDMTAQKRKLFDALRMVIETLRTPDKIRERLAELGRGHVKYGVKPEHYPLVCALILDTLAERFGRDWTAELSQDWSSALQMVSEIMLDGARAS